jgi:membrane-associated phospholipid phosphatase
LTANRHPPTPRQRARRRRRRIVAFCVAATAFAVACLIDRWCYHTFRSDTLLALTEDQVSRKDWYQLFRQVGYLPTWALIALALMGCGVHFQRERARRGARFNIHAALRPGIAIFLAAGLAGLAAEILKGVLRRQRPVPEELANIPNAQGIVYRAGDHAFDWFGRGVEGLGMGLPSSHAAVAFGGAFLLAYAYRGTRWVALLAAFGCCATRVLAGAHFVSDIVLAVVVSYAVARALRGLVRSVAFDAELTLPDGPRVRAPFPPHHPSTSRATH